MFNRAAANLLYIGSTLFIVLYLYHLCVTTSKTNFQSGIRRREARQQLIIKGEWKGTLGVYLGVVKGGETFGGFAS